MPEVDVINQFIDPDALNKQRDSVLQAAQEILDSFTKVNQALGESKNIGDLNKNIESLNNTNTKALDISKQLVEDQKGKSEPTSY